MINDKKVLYSGMQATGNLTLGNYLGALKNWVSLNEEYECFFGVMDLHSITVRQEPCKKLYIFPVTCFCTCRVKLDTWMLYLYG